MATSDPTRPRITSYDDQPGPTQGERIELSGRVLANWVAKAANLLQDEFDAGPGTVVAIELPVHWRAAYWLFAVWSVGAEAVVGPADRSLDADVLVTWMPESWSALRGRMVAVSLPALAREWDQMEPSPVLPDFVDEAKVLASYGDVFTPYDPPAPDGPALTTAERSWSFDELVPAARAAAAAGELSARARVLTSAPVHQAVESWLPAWVVDGSLVVVRADAADQGRLDQLATTERVTARR
jgi:uncharacterized protein (TIGR03089 family)